jgi:hypothetical protein
MQLYNWNRPPSNTRCLYCARRFDETTVIRSKEHLIARNFVPKGSFLGGREFNFIFAACERCNGEKSQLEGHVSAISQSLSPRIGADPVYFDIARRKAHHEFHPWTGRPVVDSIQRMSVTMPLGASVGMSLGLVGPAQLDCDQVRLLACRHVQGLFALVTNEKHDTDDVSLLPPSAVWVHDHYLRSDWGNPQLRAAHEQTRNWMLHIGGATASGYFRFVMRRDPSHTRSWYWYWLLEWNDSVRVMGGISFSGEAPAFLTALPRLHHAVMPLPNGAVFRLREEFPLAPDADDFFRRLPDEHP